VALTAERKALGSQRAERPATPPQELTAGAAVGRSRPTLSHVSRARCGCGCA